MANAKSDASSKYAKTTDITKEKLGFTTKEDIIAELKEPGDLSKAINTKMGEFLDEDLKAGEKGRFATFTKNDDLLTEGTQINKMLSERFADAKAVENAKSEAISAAASDATTKAEQALANAKSDASSKYATTTSLSSYAKTSDITADALQTKLSGKFAAPGNYVTEDNVEDIASYAANIAEDNTVSKIKTALGANSGSTLANAFNTKFGNYATTSALNTVDGKFANYATTSALNTVDGKFANYSTTTEIAKTLSGDETVTTLAGLKSKLATAASVANLQTQINNFSAPQQQLPGYQIAP